jgi:hypothetical protein
MRRSSGILALLFVVLGAVVTASTCAAAKRQVVIELYTSQGCSSCPPADALLAKLADRKDLIALSLPVTYWDMLGWKDTLASEGNTRRQKAYAQAMGRGGVYTPQIVVDGVSDVVGSRELQVESAIAARGADMRHVPVNLSATPEALHISVGPGADHNGADATVWLFRILSRASVHVGAGENGGRNLTYRNIVRDIRAVGLWKGQPLSLDLPRDDTLSAPHDAVAVVVQEGGYGRIIGAAWFGQPE